MILRQCLTEKRENLGFLTFLGGLFLAGAIYNHQVLLYPFFYIYLILTILYFCVFKTIKHVFISYAKILGLTAILLLPFLGKLYTGSQEVLAIHGGKNAPYQLQYVLSMVHNNIGLATLLAAFLGTCLYCFQYITEKDRESKFKAITVTALFIGNFIAVNIYFGGNPFWSERSLYLLGVLAALPIAYLIYFWITRWQKRVWHIFFCVLFILILGSRIEYSFNINPLWSKELQSSIEWANTNKLFIEDKTIYLVFNDAAVSSVNHVFQLAFYHFTDLPVSLIGKDEYMKNFETESHQILLDNNFYTISLQANNLYFNYKVEAIKSGDALYFRDDLVGKPRLIYTLDSMLRRYFLDRKMDQQATYLNGSGLPIFENHYVGQSFIPTRSSSDQICINLAKGNLNNENSQPPVQEIVWLELYREDDHSMLLKSDFPQKRLNDMPINQYQHYCFTTRIDFLPGSSYRFDIKTNATARIYAIMNAGPNAYTLGTAYLNGSKINDDLLFLTKFPRLLSW